MNTCFRYSYGKGARGVFLRLQGGTYRLLPLSCMVATSRSGLQISMRPWWPSVCFDFGHPLLSELGPLLLHDPALWPLMSLVCFKNPSGGPNDLASHSGEETARLQERSMMDFSGSHECGGSMPNSCDEEKPSKVHNWGTPTETTGMPLVNQEPVALPCQMIDPCSLQGPWTFRFLKTRSEH